MGESAETALRLQWLACVGDHTIPPSYVDILGGNVLQDENRASSAVGARWYHTTVTPRLSGRKSSFQSVFVQRSGWTTIVTVRMPLDDNKYVPLPLVR